MTIDQLRKKLSDMNNHVIHFNVHNEHKTLAFRDRCLANWGTTGDFVINQKAGDFGGTMSSSYSRSRRQSKRP